MIEIQNKAEEREPVRKTWTVDEYMQMVEAGILNEDDKVELLEGEIYEMSPQGDPHAAISAELSRILWRVAGDTHHLRSQLPFRIGRTSMPEPDIAIVKGMPLDYMHKTPTTADLIIEVAQSSVRIDRGIKLRLYASAGVPEYWVANLPDRVLVVHRDPSKDQKNAGQFLYRNVLERKPGEKISPLFCPAMEIDVEAILPEILKTGGNP